MQEARRPVVWCSSVEKGRVEGRVVETGTAISGQAVEGPGRWVREGDRVWLWPVTCASDGGVYLLLQTPVVGGGVGVAF